MKTAIVIFALLVFVWGCNGNQSNNNPTADSSSTHTTNDHSGAHNSPAASGNGSAVEMHDAMTRMSEHMKTMALTGDPDHDFALLMKHHHVGAVEMADALLANGKDDTLKQWARQIKTDQQQEIDVFDSFLKNNKPSRQSDYGPKAMGLMHEVTADSHNGSIDQAFVAMMIPHHQDGIEMALAYLKVANNRELKSVAQNIVSSQQREIVQFKNWLEKNKN